MGPNYGVCQDLNTPSTQNCGNKLKPYCEYKYNLKHFEKKCFLSYNYENSNIFIY